METKQPSLPTLENRVLDFWREHDIFAKTVALRRDGKLFVFYDGPPFATGLPHYGHILQMAIKDAVLRYQTMHGYNVPRKIGWDTHGLPVEYQLERELGISGKRDIESYGIENFVQAARAIVLRYTGEWTKTMERMGRWVDVSHPYATMDNDYIESVWWAFGELAKQDLIYKDFRVSPYCPRCGTVLSNFEVNLGYKDNVPDVSIYVAVPIISGPESLGDASLVLWTTTPWTLPANVALAIDPQAHYSLVSVDSKRYILAQNRVTAVFPEATIEATFTGQDLIGVQYEPLFNLSDDLKAYRVVAGHHVTTDDGTGIVHMAPAYGEDDFQVGKREGLPLLQTVSPDGTVKSGLRIPGEGKFVKEADRDIIEALGHKVIREAKIKHTYPFCYRCGTPLLYFPAESWFVAVTKVRDQLVAENKQIEWQPEHLRDGRFGRWLEGARDWAISRDRYWGAPLPVWACEKEQHTKVIGSREELNAQLPKDQQIEADFDLHRPYIDTLTFPCPSCQSTMQRVPFVFDCWFESGSMPYAQHHYPFEAKDIFLPEEQQGYPADFIAEALDQTRGWFYTLHVLGVTLFQRRAYNAAVVSGLLLAPDGKKLSKSLRNYEEPEVLFEAQGVDALRLFLFTATTLGEDYRFSEAAVADAKRRWLVPLLNVVEYYKLSQADVDASLEPESHHAYLDIWIKARVATAADQIQEAMARDERRSPYDLVRACRTFGPFIEDLSTWYVRLSRGRRDQAFTATLQTVLQRLSELYAPFLPFVMESVYQEVKDEAGAESVHMQPYPNLAAWQQPGVLEEMTGIRNVVSLGRELRAREGLPLRQPLAELAVVLGKRQLPPESRLLVQQELQVDSVRLVEQLQDGWPQLSEGNIALALNTEVTESLRTRGTANVLRRLIQDLRKQANLQPSDAALVYVAPLTQSGAEALAPQLGKTQLVTTEPEGERLGQAEHKTDQGLIAVTLYRLNEHA